MNLVFLGLLAAFFILQVTVLGGSVVLGAAPLGLYLLIELLSQSPRKASATKMKVIRVSPQRIAERMDAFGRRYSKWSSGDVTEERVVIGGLEAVLVTPPEASARRGTAVVCTHPWAPLGGDMDNNVPMTLAHAFARCGMTALRFNFRGVGNSKGCCTWRGTGERADAKAVCRWLVETQGITQIVLCGYSYGSMISNSVAGEIDQVVGYISLSSPFPCYWGLSLFNCGNFLKWSQTSKPKLLICGSGDQFTSSKKFQRFSASFPEPKKTVLVSGMDHFYFGYELGAASLSMEWLLETGIIASVQ